MGLAEMNAKPGRAKMPTEAQTRILRHLAQTGGLLMLTHDEDGDRYSDALGYTVDCRMAAILIKNGWVTPQKDSMFDLSPQTWRVRSAQ